MARFKPQVGDIAKLLTGKEPVLVVEDCDGEFKVLYRSGYVRKDKATKLVPYDEVLSDDDIQTFECQSHLKGYGREIVMGGDRNHNDIEPLMDGCFSPQIGDIISGGKSDDPVLVVSKLFRSDETRVLYSGGHFKYLHNKTLRPYNGKLSDRDLAKFEYFLSRKCRLTDNLSDRLYAYRETIEENPDNTEWCVTEKEDEMNTLYTWKENRTDVYGNKLAVNRSGQWVMETKGGDIVAVDKSVVSEVMPYTVDCKSHKDGSFVSLLAKEGDFAAGDVVVHPNFDSLLTITGVDTKSKNAKRWLYGLKLNGTKIESGE